MWLGGIFCLCSSADSWCWNCIWTMHWTWLFASLPDFFKTRVRLLCDSNAGDFDAWVSLINAAEGKSAVSGILVFYLIYFHTLLLLLFFSSCDVPWPHTEIDRLMCFLWVLSMFLNAVPMYVTNIHLVSDDNVLSGWHRSYKLGIP